MLQNPYFNNKKTIANTNLNLLNLQGFPQFLPNILRYLDNKSLLEFHLTCKQLRSKIRSDPIWRYRIVTRINVSENNAVQDAVNLGVSPSIAEDLKLENKSVEELEKFEKIRRKAWLRTLYRLEHFFDDDKAEDDNDDGKDGEVEDHQANDDEDDDNEDDDNEEDDNEDDDNEDDDNEDEDNEDDDNEDNDNEDDDNEDDKAK